MTGRLNKIGRNAKCWCGSGIKFKRCHLDREKQKRLTRQEILKPVKSTYGKGFCLHPEAGLHCKGNIVRAHSIQRNGGLTSIAKDGKVGNCLLHGKFFSRFDNSENQPNLVGLKHASVFTGFCGRHDDEIFAPVEKFPFEGSMHQVTVLAYRAICHELFNKQKEIELMPMYRSLDKGKQLREQYSWQESIKMYGIGLSEAAEELVELKTGHETMLKTKDFSSLNSCVVLLEQRPEILCNGIVQPTHDFRGNLIHRLGQVGLPSEWMHFSLLATDDGGAAVFSWAANHSSSQVFIDSLLGLGDDELPHAIVRYTFEFFENTYHSPAWWEQLDDLGRTSLMERQYREPHGRPNDCLKDDGIRTVDWHTMSRVVHSDS